MNWARSVSSLPHLQSPFDTVHSVGEVATRASEASSLGHERVNERFGGAFLALLAPAKCANRTRITASCISCQQPVWFRRPRTVSGLCKRVETQELRTSAGR